MERTAMSTKEVTRWAVMRRGRDQTMSRREAAGRLGVSYRQVKRIFRRFRTRGPKGLVHGHVGQRAKRHTGPRGRILVRETRTGDLRWWPGRRGRSTAWSGR